MAAAADAPAPARVTLPSDLPGSLKYLDDAQLQRLSKAVAVEINRVLQVSCGLFPAPLAPLDVTLQLEYPGIIGQGPTGNHQFSKSAVVVEISLIKILRPRKMRFTGIWTETRRRLNGRIR